MAERSDSHLRAVAAFGSPRWKAKTFAVGDALYCAAGCFDGSVRAWEDFRTTVDAIKADADLSPAGKAKRTKAAAAEAIKAVDKYLPAFKSIRQAEARVVRDKLTPARSADVADRILAGLRESEIRQALVSRGVKDATAARDAFEVALSEGDFETCDAIMNAPPTTPLRLQDAYLAEARTRRVAAMDPVASAELESIREAAGDIENAMATAKRLIVDMGGLDKPDPIQEMAGFTAAEGSGDAAAA